MNRILVTGATGFVGRPLCAALLQAGHSVVAAVRTRSNLDLLPDGVEPWQVGEIDGATDWPARRFDGIDSVIHLAARVHVLKESAADPAAEFHKTNVLGTERLVRAAAGRVRRFVYVSSLHAMCSLAKEVLNERSTCRPDTPYGRSKWEAEQRVTALGQETGLQTVIVRPPPVYGPGGIGNLMSLLKWIRRGWPLPIGGIANQRSMIYVGNLVDVLMQSASHPEADGRTFLVSDGENVSISELARRAAAAFRQPARLWPMPARTLRLGSRLVGRTSSLDRLIGSLAVDISTVRKALDWQPVYSLDEALHLTGNWLHTAR